MLGNIIKQKAWQRNLYGATTGGRRHLDGLDEVPTFLIIGLGDQENPQMRQGGFGCIMINKVVICTQLVWQWTGISHVNKTESRHIDEGEIGKHKFFQLRFEAYEIFSYYGRYLPWVNSVKRRRLSRCRVVHQGGNIHMSVLSQASPI